MQRKIVKWQSTHIILSLFYNTLITIFNNYTFFIHYYIDIDLSDQVRICNCEQASSIQEMLKQKIHDV